MVLLSKSADWKGPLTEAQKNVDIFFPFKFTQDKSREICQRGKQICIRPLN